jgi:hypothetical protein
LPIHVKTAAANIEMTPRIKKKYGSPGDTDSSLT